MDNGVEERLLGSEAEEQVSLRQKIWVEVKRMWKIAFPSIVARVTSFGLLVVAQLFLARVGNVQLAAFSLAQSLLLRFVNGILLGMSSATETLCGQAFGAKQYHMMGIYLQRSWIVDTVTATVLLPLFIFATPIFRALGEEEAIAVASGPIALWMIPILYSFVFTLTVQMYLQAQQKNMIIAWLSAGGFLLELLTSWIFVNVLDLGVAGAMGAYGLSSWLVVLGGFVYVFGGWCPNTWKGFTLAAFKDIWPVVKLSISSGVMLCLELWYNSVLVLCAGYLQNATVEISAFSICLNICAWEFMLCLGFLTAACVRVSNELGAGNAKAAKFSIKIILCISLSIGIIFWALCLAFGSKIGYLFTSDEEIVEAISSLSTLLAFSILLNSIQPVLSGKWFIFSNDKDYNAEELLMVFNKDTSSYKNVHQRLTSSVLSLGVAIGAGLQGTVAFINIGCYYFFGVPVALLLGYVAKLEVQGLWIGLLSGVLMQTIALAIMIWRVNWDEQVKKASERLNRWVLNPSGESN